MSMGILGLGLKFLAITVLPLNGDMCDKALNYFHDYLRA